MARSRGKKSAKAAPTVAIEQAKPERRRTFGDESSGEEAEEADEIEERDEEEAELERMVLGDEAGFMDGIERDEDDEEMDLGDEDEAALEKELGLQDETDGVENVDDADLFFLDDGPAGPISDALIPQPPSDDESDASAPAWEDSDDDRLMVSLATNSRLRKLRVNEAEDMINGREYTKRLRRQFERITPLPAWANPETLKKKRRSSSTSSVSSASSITSDIEMDADEDLSALPLEKILRNAGSLLKAAQVNKRSKLRPEVVNITRLRDIPGTQPSTINALHFHPQYPVILSSGPASTMYMHQIANDALPTPHPLLTSVHIKKTPLHTSSFLGPEGDKIIFAGRRRYFHIWDLPSGEIRKVSQIVGHRDEIKTFERIKSSPDGKHIAVVGSSIKGGGTVHILDATTTQWIASARLEGKNGIADFVWWRDSTGLTIASKSGEIGEWDLKSRSFAGLWVDEGGAGTTCITLGGNSGNNLLGGDRWIVIGSQSGIVTIYDRRNFISPTNTLSIPQRPEAERSFKQLTTPTSCMEISADGQLLVFASRWKRDALKLVHLPSCTVFRNWPTSQTPFGRISAVGFNKDGDELGVANEQGKIRLWKIVP